MQFYSYLLGELENAKVIGNSVSLSKDEAIKMKKLERYLRMLQKGLQDPTNETNNKKRRKFAKDMLDGKKEVVTPIKPYFSDDIPLDKIERMLKQMTNLTNYEKYEMSKKSRNAGGPRWDVKLFQRDWSGGPRFPITIHDPSSATQGLDQ